MEQMSRVLGLCALLIDRLGGSVTFTPDEHDHWTYDSGAVVYRFEDPVTGEITLSLRGVKESENGR